MKKVKRLIVNRCLPLLLAFILAIPTNVITVQAEEGTVSTESPDHTHEIEESATATSGETETVMPTAEEPAESPDHAHEIEESVTATSGETETVMPTAEEPVESPDYAYEIEESTTATSGETETAMPTAEEPQKFEEWTEEMLEIQGMIDKTLEDWLIWYGFVMPDEEKFEALIQAELLGEEVSANLTAEWEVIHAQIEDVVINKMTAGERENAITPVREVEYVIEAYGLNEEQVEALIVANPVFLDFADMLNFNSVDINVLKSGTHEYVNGKVTISYSGTSSSDTGTQSDDTSGYYEAYSGWSSYSTNTITIQNTSGSDAAISFTYALSGAYTSCSLGSGGTYTSSILADGETFSFTLAGKRQLLADNAKVTLTGIALTQATSNPEVTIEFDSNLGEVTVGGVAVTSGTVQTVTSGTSIALSTTGSHQFLGWVNGDGLLMSTDISYTLTPVGNMTIKAIFAKDGGAPIFGVGSMSNSRVVVSHLFDNWDSAMESGSYIVLMNNATLPARNTAYDVPSGKTLLIPFDENNTLYTTAPGCTQSYVQPTVYRKLTMASEANITVNGAISISGEQVAGGSEAGAPKGPVGFIDMQSNSSITVNSGANLYAWGYIIGSGNVTIKSGGTVYEDFQVMNWRGGTAGTGMIGNSYRVFPLSQYYVQNVEVPMKLEAGASEVGYISVSITLMGIQKTSFTFVGSGGLFNVESGYIIKDYDEVNDRLIIEAYEGHISMDKITAKLAGYSINSSDYDLPINGNITVNIKSGCNVTLQENVLLQPGAILNIEAGAECTVAKDKKIYIFDSADWGDYALQAGQKCCPIIYAPGRGTKIHDASQTATVSIAGKVDAAQGFVYVTDGGANIIGVEGAIITTTADSETAVIYQALQNNKEITYDEIVVKPAVLKNGDGSIVDTASATTTTTYEYVGTGTEGKWLISCGQTHTFDQKESAEIAVPADCVNPAQVYVLCDNDGCTIITTEKTVASTSAEVGFTALKHAKDGTTKIRRIEEKVNDCENAGYIEHFRCILCNALFEDQAGTTALKEEDILLAAKGHTYDSGVIKEGDEASCTKKGLKTYTCINNNSGIVCSESYTVEIDKLQHTEETIVAVEPTCTATGLTEGKKCSVCGEITVSQKEVAALGHAYKVVDALADECKDGVTGYKESYRCESDERNYCGLYFSEKSDDAIIGDGGWDAWFAWTKDAQGGLVDDAEHTPGDTATCTTAQICTVCEAVVSPATGHIPGDIKQENINQETGVYENVVYCTECGTEISRKTIVPGVSIEHTVEYYDPVDPTCTEAGKTAGAVCVDKECVACAELNKTYQTGLEEIPALGHTLEGVEVSYTFNEDYTSCYATGVCVRCAETTGVTTTNITKKVTEPTCEVGGEIVYTAVFAEEMMVAAKTETVANGDALSHAWSEVSFKWDYENNTCIATQLCSNNTTTNCARIATDNAIQSTYTEPSCEQDSYSTYTAQFQAAWMPTDAKTQISRVDNAGSAIGHSWNVDANSTAWKMVESEMTCTANLICANDATHSQAGVVATKVDKTTQVATCEQDGYVTYTATFDEALGIDPQTKTEVLTALNHSWEYSYEWSSDNTSCTATRTCQNDETHRETETVNTTADAGTATCTQAGKITYTTESFTNAAFAVQTKQVNQAALDHDMTEHAYKAPTCQATGNYEYYTCDRCDGVFVDSNGETSTTVNTRIIGKVDHKYEDTDYESDGNATCEADGTKTAECIYGCGETDTKTDVGSKLGHNYVGEVTAQPTCTKEGIKTFTCQNDKNHTYNEAVSTLGHAFIQIDGQAPTCEVAGWYSCWQCASETGEGERTSYCGYYFAKETDTEVAATPIATTIDELTNWQITAGAIAALGHEDTDFDHVCGHDNCDAAMGEHVDESPKDHICDYYGEDCALGRLGGECSDVTTDKDHLCDYCNASIGDHEYVDGLCNCGEVQTLNVNVTIKAEGAEDVVLDPETTKYGQKYTKTLDLSSFGNCFSINDVTVTVSGETVSSRFTDDQITISGSYVAGDIEIVVEAIQRHVVGTTTSSITKEATCTEAGEITTVITCKNCNTPFSTSTSAILARGHNYNTVYTAPTFDAEGYNTYTCQIYGCEHTYTEIVADKLKAVAKIGEQRYESLEAAIEAAVAGDTIELLMPVAVEGTQVWDLTGITLKTAVAEDGYSLTVRGDLTIEDGNFQVVGFYGIGVTATGKLTVNDGEIGHVDDNDYLIGSWGNVVIKGGVFNGQYNCVNGFAGTVTISGGIFTTEATDCTDEYESEDLLGNVTVTGGCFSKTVAAYLTDGYCQKVSDDYYVVGQHVAGEVVEENKVEADCTNDGSYEMATYCIHCGEEMSREDHVITAIGHDYEWEDGKVVTRPTCTEKGYTTYMCSVCEESHIEAEVVARGHLMTEIDATPATCEADGNNRYFICSRCDGIFKDENGKTPTTKEAEFLQRTGHNYDTGVYKDGQAPTCTEVGTLTFTCQNDATHTYTESVDALGHDYSREDCIIGTTPTCTADGYTTYTCARCGDIEVQTAAPATGHIGEWMAGQVATCLNAGWKTYYQCQNSCGMFFEDAQCTKPIGYAHDLEEWKVGGGAKAPLGHSYKPVIGRNPDCVNVGYKAYYQCVRCKLYFAEDTSEAMIGDGSEQAVVTWKAEGGEGYLKATGHTEGDIQTENIKAPSCTVDGSHDEVIYCTVCTVEISRNKVTDPAFGHTEKEIPAKEPTCTATGLTTGVKCAVCDKILTAQHKVDALGHTEVLDVAVAATCTATGLTEGKHCSVCNAVLRAQAEVPMIAHDLTIASVTPANCVTDGFQVLKCTACDYETNEVLAATGHIETKVPAKEATCTATGLTEGTQCSVCGEVLVAREVVDRVAHTEVIDAAVAATCTATGLTEGKHCSVCNGVLVNQAIVAALGHTEVLDVAVAATCTATGLTEGKHCSVCNAVLVKQKETPALGHSEVVDAAVATTCTATGLTEGKHCSVCNEVLIAQEEVPAKGHAEVIDSAVTETCEAIGLTEGKHCSRCNEVLVAQEEIPALGHDMCEATCSAPATCKNGCGLTEGEALPHTWLEEEEIPPLCEEPGYTAGKRCSVCGTTEGIYKIAASGHAVMYVEAKKPTFGNIGWEAYERCMNCSYTTMVEIPALPIPSVTTYDEFIESLIELEKLTAEYVKQYPAKDPLGLMIEYIRTGVDRYNSGSWNIMAGYEDADYAAFISRYEDEINSQYDDIEDMIKVTALKDIHEFVLPNGDGVDFGHMFGTMDITYHNNFSANHADVAGWAGDLVDLLSTADRHNVYAQDEEGNYPTIEEMTKEIGETYLMHDIVGEDDQFGHSDMYGDLDGFYLMQTLQNQGYETGDLAEIMQAYFTEGLTDEYRAEYFLKNRLDGVSTRNAVRDAVYSEYVSNKVIFTLEGTRDFITEDVSQMRIACCYAFADYLCKLGGDYVEVPDNQYYTVFESEFSTLAPGITQEIKKATTADNKQIVYYIATADLSRGDVNVYANYNENDPTLGWKMSRVLDQANAAQNKYGNPESEQYIKNYNVIASINADGYNMSTGEPGGVLVMNGVEYHPVNSNGFFGILENGQAVIGTTAEYNEMKDQVQEAVAGFGTMLVNDGEIAISRTDNYYSNRASRTAVGITRSGKVIFMVLDGRQEPVSCGGSMQEIAQIMLEAGCYYAINLDGGGSTTYVAKPEGEDGLKVVNNPSDGSARSVSTSLMMVSTAPSSTAFDHAVVESHYDYLTPSSTVQVTAKGVSATGNEAEIPEGAYWIVDNTEAATITEDGMLTGVSLGTVQVSLMLGNEILGTKSIYVVNPDTVYFIRETLNAVYGAATELPVKALYQGKVVAINTGDVEFSLSNPAAGTFDGFDFTANAESGLKAVMITAALTSDSTKTGSIRISLYNQGEMSFDFDMAIGGDRQLAWDRKVSNATTDDNSIYEVVEVDEPMVTTYTFALDMSEITMPEKLEDLTYMLPGADAADASAWNFLLQLAERVSVLTEVSAKMYFDKNFEVDYSNLKIICEYFAMNNPETDLTFNEEENSLTLTLHWKDQTQAIDPETADSLCLLSGIKLTPKEDATWDAKNRLVPVHTGEISYNIFLRANALYNFASKEVNQREYGLLPFENPDVIIGGATEKGGSFQDTYTTFQDTYTLINAVKNGWVGAEGGYMYYINGEYYTDIQEVDGCYYDFGENGICIGQQKYNGLFEKDGKTYYARFGVLVNNDWISVGDDLYRFDDKGVGLDGTVEIDEVDLEFENGKLVGGYSGFITKSDENTYYYVNGVLTLGWYLLDDDWYHFDTGTGVMNTGTHVLPDAEAKSKGAHYDFTPDGKLISGYFNNAGYYYWPELIDATIDSHIGTGRPKIFQWVQSGSVADDWPANGATKDSWYYTNSHGHFVTGGNDSTVYDYVVDGVSHKAIDIEVNDRVYTFDNDHGYLLRGFFSYENDNWYYYWVDEAVNDGWFDVDGETYYAYEDGHLAVGSHVIEGETYMFDYRGALIKEGIRLLVSWNADGSVMTVATSETNNLERVRLAIWSDANGQNDLLWVDAVENEKGEWVAKVPMCQFNDAGEFLIHAYASTASGAENMLINTTTQVAKVFQHVEGTPVVENLTDAVCVTSGSYDLVTYCAICKSELAREYVVVSAKGHVYIDDKDATCDVCGEVREITSEDSAERIVTTPMYRLYNPNTGEHFYTGSVEECDMLKEAGWNYEGVAWNAPVCIGDPVYRVYNPNSSDHHYTMSQEEVDSLLAVGWEYEGVAWNSAPVNHLEAIPQYRMYNPNADCGSHHYTSSMEERQMLEEAGWIYEGVGWFGLLK